MNRSNTFWRSFFIMLLTIALQNVLVYGVNLADNIMLGRYSETAMSGAALVNQIQFLLQMLITGAGEGIIVLAARHWGAGELPALKRAAAVGIRWATAFSVGMFVIAFFFPGQVLGLLTDKDALIAEGAAYLRIIAFTYPVFAITNMLLSTLRSVETTRIGFGISLSTLLINVTLNSILIFGKLGAPALGIRGAAIATLTSRIVELVIVGVYLAAGDKKLRLHLSELWQTDRQTAARYRKTSVPVILSSGSWGIAMGLQTAILGRLDAAVVPANSIAATVFSIVTVFVYGSATAAAVALGKMIGENNAGIAAGTMNKAEAIAAVKSRSRTLQWVFLLLGLASSLLLFLLKSTIIRFYSVSPETARLANSFMNVLCITIIGTAYEMPVLTGIIRAGGDTAFVFYNDLLFMWGIVLPASFAAAFWLQLSPVIVFICLKSDQILKCIVAVIKVNRLRWIRDI